MGWDHLSLEREAGIAICRISNPPTQTLTGRGVAELHEMLDEVERDHSTRVLVLTGCGEGVFIAHYEVSELAEGAEGQGASACRGQAELPLPSMHRLCLRLERMSAVTIAALNGSAAGGGCEISLACDFRLMCDGPFAYGLPETSVGIIPGAGGTQRLARLLGTAAALDLILHARMLSPGEALDLGLVHRVFPESEFEREVEAFARNLAQRAPVALAAAKQAIYAGASLELEAALAVEQRCFERTLRSRDAAGAMRAWLNGENWTWKGE